MKTMRKRIEMNASADRAWEVLGEGFGEMSEWDSGMATTVLDRDRPEVGAVRTCHSSQSFGPFEAGAIKEELIAFDREKKTFTYLAVEGLPGFVKRAQNRWWIEATGENECVVAFEAHLELALWATMLWPFLGAMMNKDLGRWTEDMVHLVERGVVHPRNAAKAA